MVRGSKAVHLRDAAAISKALFDVLVCPLSRQPLRYCQETQSMISDAIGVSFPVVDGIPCLIPKDDDNQNQSEAATLLPNRGGPVQPLPTSIDKNCNITATADNDYEYYDEVCKEGTDRWSDGSRAEVEGFKLIIPAVLSGLDAREEWNFVFNMIRRVSRGH